MLYRNATLFLFYLRQVDKNSTRVENELHISMKNKELIQMLGLEKSLVYFSTALKSNEIVLEKMLRLDFVKDLPRRHRPARGRHRGKQAGHRDERHLPGHLVRHHGRLRLGHLQQPEHRHEAAGFGPTIILTVPTIVSSLWGMNVPVPFEGSPFGFWIVLGVAGLATLGAILLAKYKRWL